MIDKRVEALKEDYVKAVKAYDDLLEAVIEHRLERYGRPPQRPFYDVDRKLYERAGIEP